MTRGRKPLPAAEQVGPQHLNLTPPAMAEQERRMMLAIEQQESNAQALAVALGYEGSMSLGSLEDEIRFYQRRTGEACLEMGKRLLILRELTPHGEFSQRVELLGIGVRLAQRFMSAATKFGKAAAPPLLRAAANQSKMLELLVLDDDEITELDAGGSVRGVTLDALETMSHKELRAALRDSKAKQQATERLLGAKNEKIDELATKLSLVHAIPPDKRLTDLRQALACCVVSVEAEVTGRLLPTVEAIHAHHQEHGGDSVEVVEGALRQVEQAVASIRADCALPKNGDWGASG